MRKTILFTTFVLIVAIVFALLLVKWNFQERFSLARSIYLLKVEELAKAISLGYFQWNHMYQIVSENDSEEIERQFYQIKEDFPQIKEVRLVKRESFDFSIYKIISRGTELIFTFNIFNDDLTEFVQDKVALATVDAQQILSSLEIKEIRISEKGRNFVFDLKAQRIRLSLVDLFILLFCILGAVVSYFGAMLVQTKTKLKVEEQMRKKIEKEQKVAQIMLDMMVSFLQNRLENEYEYCLKKAIEVVPGSQAGSVLIKDGERYVYVAAVGFDLQKLREISFSSEEISEWTSKTFCVRTNVKEYNEMNMQPEKLELLRKFARIDEIRSTLIISVKLKEEIALLLNIDNFEREDAFTDESVELAKLFANHLGVVLQRKILEKQILQQAELLEYLSYHDSLTGLANRRMFEEHSEKLLSLARREGKKVSVLFMDLKNFKEINDRYGHQIGDEILRIMGSRLEKSIRESDLVARFGGDEFVIMLYDCSSEGLNSFIKRIVNAVEEPIELASRVFRVSCNIGIAQYPDDGEEIDQMVRKADVLMYEAKSKFLVHISYNEKTQQGC